MVNDNMTYAERKEAALQSLQTARDALDAAERRLVTYVDILSESTNQGYLRQQHEAMASQYRGLVLRELTETVGHLADVVAVWWPALAPFTFGHLPDDAA